jgi:hypothetical protein
MLCGDSARFAVEVKLDKDPGGEWLFGKACYWVGRRRIGAYEEGTSLSDLLAALVSVARESGQRTHADLFGLSTQTLVQRLRAGLFGEEDPSLAAVVEEERWGRFNLKPSVDVFDHYFVFLVEDPPRARVVYFDGHQQLFGEAELAAGEADAVLVQAITVLSEWDEATRQEG